MSARSLIDLDDYSEAEIEGILQRAAGFGQRPASRSTLEGVCVLNMFFERSTRTAVSFAIAERRLGADAVWLEPESSSLGKGESIADTGLTLWATGVRVIVVRHPEAGFPYELAQNFGGHVVNAGDGNHAHPTQALLDLQTIRAEFGKIRGVRVAFVGDVLHSRVAHSNIAGLRKLGGEAVCVGPPEFVPDALRSEGVRVERSLSAALATSDVVMLLRIQRERLAGELTPEALEGYVREYRMDAARLRELLPHAIVMHPGPYNRDVELTQDVLEFARWRYLQQVGNGVCIRMAVLDFLVNGSAAA